MCALEIDEREQLSGDAAIQKVRELLPLFHTAMMITRANGEVHVRPLAMQGELAMFGGTLWFFTDRRSRKVQESEGGEPVSIICQSDEHHVYLHLIGTAAVVDDRQKMRELYSPVLRAWFPKGLEDEQLTLLRFDAASGTYWRVEGGLVQSVLSIAKAVAMGQPSKTTESADLRL